MRKIRVVLTWRALNRINDRFGVQDPIQIGRVLNKAVKEGTISSTEGDILVEHGCLLLAGKHNGNGTFTVQTVYNLSEGISKRLKERLANTSPSPWQESEVILPEDRSYPIVQQGTAPTHPAKGYGAVKEPT